jgi:serine/threonine-protein kinase
VVCPEVPSQLDAPIVRMLAKEPSARPASVGEALESLVAAGHAAGVLSGAVVLPPPSQPTLGDRAHADTATGPTIESLPAPPYARVVTGGETSDVSPNGSTFLGAEADVTPPRRSRAKLGIGIVAAVALLVGVGGGFVFLRGSHAASAGTGIVVPPASTPTPPATTTATSSATSTGAGASDPAPVADVELRIEGAPKDAVVKEGTRELGAAPGPFKLKAGVPVTLTVSAKGYKPKDVQATPTSNGAMRVTLERQGGKPAGPQLNKDLEGF